MNSNKNFFGNNRGINEGLTLMRLPLIGLLIGLLIETIKILTNGSQTQYIDSIKTDWILFCIPYKMAFKLWTEIKNP